MLGFFVWYDLHCFALCRDLINIAMWPWNGQQRETETGICTASQTAGWMGRPMMARHADAKKKNKKKNENMKDGSENKFYTVFFLSFPVTAVALPAAPEACLIEFRIGCKWVRHGFVLACAHCQVQGGGRGERGIRGQKFSLSLPRHLLQTSVVEATRIAQTHASSTVPHSMSKYSCLPPPPPAVLPLLLQCHKIAWI